jgi:hypothetical protein
MPPAGSPPSDVAVGASLDSSSSRQARRRWLNVAGAGLAGAVLPRAGVAAAYPERTITFICPWPVGGTADLTMRALCVAAGRHLGQSIVVENRAGAAGMLGLKAMASARPDGYTVGQIPISVTRFSLLGSVAIDPMKDLTYLARTSGQTFGIAPVDWLGKAEYIKPAISLIIFWRFVGFNTVLYLAALQTIPKDLYEAATMDGASRLQQFFFITLPLLRPVILFCVVLSVIGTMQLFAEPFLITNRGGPGGATETLGLFLYRQGFTVLNFGYASAVAYTVAGLAVLISVLNLWLGRERA